MANLEGTARDVPARAGLRLPLLVGVRAYRLLATVPAWVLFGASTSLILAVAGPDLPFAAGAILGKVGSALCLALCVSPIALLFAAGFLRSRLKRAISARACDVVVTADELRVIGGSANGFTARFSELAAGRGVQFSPTELTVQRADGIRLRVPVPPDAEEASSLEALASVIGATALARVKGSATPAREPPDLIRCVGCGGPLAPGMTGAIRCPYCGAENPLSPLLAAKLSAGQTLARQHDRDEALCRALLRQPGARLANTVAFVGSVAVIAAAGAAALMAGAFFILDGKEAGLPRLAGLGLIEMGVALLLVAFVRRALSNRRALRVLTLGFSAVPAEREGGLPSCRSCGGPLAPAGARELLTRCEYCAAENLRVVDLRVDAAIVSRFSGGAASPGEALREPVHDRRQAGRIALAGAAAIAFGVVWLQLSPKPPPLDATTVLVPLEMSREGRPGQPPSVVESSAELVEEADLPGAVLALFPAPRGEVAVLMRGASSTRIVEAPHGAVTPDVLRGAPELPLAEALDRHSARDPLLVVSGGRVNCLQANGATTLLYGDTLLSDRLITDIDAGPGCTAYATTRASKEGHFGIRYLEGSGSSLVRSDARHAAPSPDGTRLAVTVLDQHERFQLAILAATGKANERLVTRGPGHVAHPAWSPDGTRVAFLTQSVRDGIQYAVRTGSAHLFMTNLEGGLVRLTSGGSLSLLQPLWTERGIYVVAGANQGHSRLLRVVPRSL